MVAGSGTAATTETLSMCVQIPEVLLNWSVVEAEFATNEKVSPVERVLTFDLVHVLLPALISMLPDGQ